MSLILTRSPYLISRGNRNNEAVVELDLFVYENGVSKTIFESFVLAFRDSQYLDISPILSSYVDEYPVFRIDAVVDGGGSGKTNVYEGIVVTDGYYYTEEGNAYVGATTTLRGTAYYAGSTDVIYKDGDDGISLPFLVAENDADFPASKNIDIYIQVYNKGELVISKTESVLSDEHYDDFTDLLITYSDIGSSVTFEQRVLDDGGVFEGNRCLIKFEDSFFDDEFDEIVITTNNGYSHKLTIVNNQECRYPKQLLKFKNKYGVYENTWFLAKSTDSLSVNNEKYRANNLDAYVAGNLTHTYKLINRNGMESITLNTGFVPESLNETYKQLMLSEEVYLLKDDIERPVNIKSSDFGFKYHRDEKLINYTIEIEFANDVINTIN